MKLRLVKRIFYCAETNSLHIFKVFKGDHIDCISMGKLYTYVGKP